MASVQTRPARVRVTAPARLHIGFLDLNGDLGRRFGSIGLAVDRPALSLRLSRAATPSVSGAEVMRAPEAALAETFAEVAALKASGGTDRFGRRFAGVADLTPPYAAVKVTGALFHTQGGLVVDDDARVLDPDGRPFEGLFAAGGAACGVSGSQASGYLSGNGLLTAFAYGALAGAAAARTARGG